MDICILFLNSAYRIIHEPQKICAVCCQITTERVTECIGDCPKMYGDPAVFFKKFYQPEIDQIKNTRSASFCTGVLSENLSTTTQMFPEYR